MAYKNKREIFWQNGISFGQNNERLNECEKWVLNMFKLKLIASLESRPDCDQWVGSVPLFYYAKRIRRIDHRPDEKARVSDSQWQLVAISLTGSRATQGVPSTDDQGLLGNFVRFRNCPPWTVCNWRNAKTRLQNAN